MNRNIVTLVLLSCIACDSNAAGEGGIAGIEDQEQRILDGFDLSIVKPGNGTVRVSWESQGVGQYEVWASHNPYFAPGDPNSTLVGSGPQRQYSTLTNTEQYYRVRAPGAVVELSTTVGQLPYSLYSGYTKLGWCLVSEIDTWRELKVDIASMPSYGAMWDALTQTWLVGASLTFDVGEVLSVLHRHAPNPATYTAVGYVPTESDVQVDLLPGDNLVTSLPLRAGSILASDLLDIVESGERIGGWNPATQTTHWYPDDGDFVLPACSPVHVQVSAPSAWPPPQMCGDGFTSPGEACDDDGESSACDGDCTFAECGDAVVNETAGEDCDEGAVDTATCNEDCTAAQCGDGYLNAAAGEQCDDGNSTDYDGCSSECGYDLSLSCSALHALSPALPSGNYILDTDGAGAAPPFTAYCDMDHDGGGWTNLDFANDQVLLDNGHRVYCHGGLTSTANAITCDNPFFSSTTAMPLFHFACAGTDDSADYILDHMAPGLGHRNSVSLGFSQLQQRNVPGEGFSVLNLEYCYVEGQVVLWSDPLCDEYNRPTNASCIPNFFTLRFL